MAPGADRAEAPSRSSGGEGAGVEVVLQERVPEHNCEEPTGRGGWGGEWIV